MAGKLTVLLIGLGNIAYKYDSNLEGVVDKIDKQIARTHLGAALQAGCLVVGGVDLDLNARDNFEKFSKLKTWSRISDVPNDIKIDIYVVSSPETAHFNIIKEILLNCKPLGIICEKPFGKSSKDSRLIIEAVNSNGIPLLVNYTRQFATDYVKVRDSIRVENFVTGTFMYSHGLRRSGSHFLRIILGLFGNPISFERTESDYGSDTPSFNLQYPNGRIFKFIGTKNMDYRMAEAHIECKNSILIINEGNNFTLYENPIIGSSPFWPMEGKVVMKGNLSNGLAQIYRDRSWLSPSSLIDQQASNRIDHSCNEIMDTLLNYD